MIELGSALFTLVEPHPGHEVAYNRWYERDHFYAGCLVGPWLFAGRRFVATRDLKQRRFGAQPDVFGGAGQGSYLALYWVLRGRHDEHVQWALDQVRWLHANGRMFSERDHVHTLIYRHRWAFDLDPDGVPAELALDHPYRSLVATFLERPAPGSDVGVREWLEAVGATSLSLALEPVPLPDDAPVTQPGLSDFERRTMLLTFSDDDVDVAWEAHVKACERLDPSTASVLWASPFVPTVPGTDTYTDQL